MQIYKPKLKPYVKKELLKNVFIQNIFVFIDFC